MGISEEHKQKIDKWNVPNKNITRWVLNPTCFMLNTLAMGDAIAAVPVVKYMIENYYTDPCSYMVVAKQMFRPFFHFIPDSNFRNYEDKDNDWGIPADFSISALNAKNQGKILRNVPRMYHLSEFASIKLADRILTLDELNYVPLKKVNIDKFGPFSSAVILVSTYRDETRAWKADYMLEIAAWIRKQDLLPVFVGKTDMNMDTHLIPKSDLPEDISAHGLDLRNKTTISELATIMSKSRAVIGLDSGPIHLAGCTDVPIVCGYTTVDAIHRVPIRTTGVTYVVKPELECLYCESRWASHYWNYEQCFLGTAECCNQMKADKFIQKLKLILA
jgi:ADP-heptose:LPS heptosyltransferase